MQNYLCDKYYNVNPNQEGLIDVNKGNVIILGINPTEKLDLINRDVELSDIERRGKKLVLKFKNGHDEVQCESFKIYTPFCNSSPNEKIIAVLDSSQGIDLSCIEKTDIQWKNAKKILGNAIDVSTEQCDQYVHSLSIENNCLKTNVNVQAVKTNVLSNLNFFTRPLFGSYVEQMLKEVLRGKTEIQLPIKYTLFKGEFLNECEEQKETFTNKIIKEERNSVIMR